MARRSLFLVSTIFFAFTLDAALLFGPERPLSPIDYAPPLGTQLPSSIATDGNEFFVVWVDGMFERSGIYGTRVTAAGEIRPESQIVIHRGASSEAAVVWSGNAYLVFWTDSSTIMMAKISREGVLLGAPRVLLERAGVMGGAVVTNGTHVLVPYMTLSPDLHALLIDNDGGILSDEVVARGTDTNRAIKAATDGSSFVLTWTTRYSQHGMQLFASRINAQGKVERDRQLIAGDFIDDADIAYGGGTYAAVVRLTGSVPQHIVAMTVDRQTLVPAEPVLLDAQSHEPAIAYNGSTFVAYWSTLRGLRATTFPTSGSGLPKSVIVNSVVSSSPRFAWNGRNFLAVWMDQTRGDAVYSYGTDVFAQLLDSSGIPAVPAPSLVAFAPATQVMPAIATSGAESYVVWVERTTDKPAGRLLAARVAADGGTEVPLEIAGNATVAVPPRIIRGSSARAIHPRSRQTRLRRWWHLDASAISWPCV